MITQHFRRVIKDVLQRGGANYDAYAVTGADGRTYYTAQEAPAIPANQTAVSMSTTQPGVMIGSGNASESDTSYWLDQQITSGFIASVIPTHEMVDGEHALNLIVTVTNTGDSSMTISEIGYALITPVVYRPREYSSIGAPSRTEVNLLIDRTVLASPVTIEAESNARLKYSLKTADIYAEQTLTPASGLSF